jgi:hypothetical protein
MVNEFAADLCCESLRTETDLDAFPRRRKVESSILFDDGGAMIGYRRSGVGHPMGIQILSNRVFDPFAVLVRTERVAADGRLRSDSSIAAFDEQIQTKSTVGHRVLPCN